MIDRKSPGVESEFARSFDAPALFDRIGPVEIDEVYVTVGLKRLDLNQ